jgi:hypothetical protein
MTGAQPATMFAFSCAEPSPQPTRSAGVTFHQTLKKQPWGGKNFVVKDPDGNFLLFAGPAN